jgi:hypothetical protein
MAYDPASLDAAFAALAAFDWGADAAAFAPIDAAVIAAHGDAAARADVEKRLAAVLGGGPSRAAKEYACRKLSMIGTAASVPALASLLADPDSSHMARFALERIAAPEASSATETETSQRSQKTTSSACSLIATFQDRCPGRTPQDRTTAHSRAGRR